MFEFEVNHTRLDTDEIPDHIKVNFKDAEADIRAVALLTWEEHCSECAMPACYETCDLYAPRKDGKCRRFIDGISPIHGVDNLQNCIVRIRFKRWAGLLTYANCNLYTKGRARLLERGLNAMAEWVGKIPDHALNLAGRRGISSRMMLRLKHGFSVGGWLSERHLDPDYFLVEVYNPGKSPVPLSLSMRNTDGDRRAFPFQELMMLAPGFNRFRFPFSTIAKHIDPKTRFTITFSPNILESSQEGLTLYFGMLTFVADANYARRQAARAIEKTQDAGHQASSKTVKVLIWDLDNTVWDGILIEDGPEKIGLRPGVVDVIKTLDQRGIVNSIASKNNEPDALAQLDRFGIREYFVFPQISWDPKGDSVRTIIADFNVGADTVAFIDDQPFEREQVAALNPKVRVLGHEEYGDLLNRPEFDPPLSAESSKRRQFYIEQGERSQAQKGFSGEYEAFIRSCEIKLTLHPASPANIDRIHELIQRTNQLNFSGNRYTRDQVADIVSSGGFDSFAMECKDKFGEYGVVGFALVDKARGRIVDLMFSCRVQAKRVEHAFLIFLMERLKAQGFKWLEADYVRTDRNQAAAKVFQDLGFIEHSAKENHFLYRFDISGSIPQEDLISVDWQGEPA